ncbi:MAG: sortase [Caldilineaceae bacterium]
MWGRFWRHPRTYTIGGIFLTTCGLILASLLTARVLAETVETQLAAKEDYLLIATTLEPPLPPPRPTAMLRHSTATPLLLPTPTATPTLAPQPPIRLEISRIGLNSHIVETAPISWTTRSGTTFWQWPVVDFAVGHQNLSGKPNGGTNIVLAGHNNTAGMVFRDLYLLEVGDLITLYTADQEFEYTVMEKVIVPYRRDPVGGEALLQHYMAPTATEQVTLLSCYPYATNADRIVIRAKPGRAGDSHE